METVIATNVLMVLIKITINACLAWTLVRNVLVLRIISVYLVNRRQNNIFMKMNVDWNVLRPLPEMILT